MVWGHAASRDLKKWVHLPVSAVACCSPTLKTCSVAHTLFQGCIGVPNIYNKLDLLLLFLFNVIYRRCIPPIVDDPEPVVEVATQHRYLAAASPPESTRISLFLLGSGELAAQT